MSTDTAIATQHKSLICLCQIKAQNTTDTHHLSYHMPEMLIYLWK